MAYSTATTIQDFLPNVANTSTMVDFTATSALITAHITRADSVVDLHISRRYALPFAAGSIPPVIRTISEDIATWKSFRALFPNDSIEKNDLLDAYDRAFDWLTDIRDGKMDLLDTAGSLITEKSADSKLDSNTDTFNQTFNQDTATSWKTDPDLIADIQDETN